MGHEFVDIVEQVGNDVTAVTPGRFVIGSSLPPLAKP